MSGDSAAGTVRARIVLFPTMDGGRAGPIHDGYRPHVTVSDGEMLGVTVRMVNDASISPGDDGEVTLVLMYPEVDYSPLTSGAEFTIREGHRGIGAGKVH